MALFHKRPQSSDPINFVTVGRNKTLLIVGLGNIGKQYADTRHNIGFNIVDNFVTKSPDIGEWVVKKDLKCLMASGRVEETRVIVIKPTTMMNLSGQAVQATVNFYKVAAEQILVVHDELDFDFGQIRTRMGGGSAGHNGIKSIIEHINENFARMRIGVGPKQPDQIDSADFVLAKFSKNEQAQITNLLQESNSMLSEHTHNNGQLNTETRHFIV